MTETKPVVSTNYHATRGYYAIRDELRRRLAESAPARVQLLVGPRQVGKTTLLLELKQEWGERAIYIAADAPDASLPGWWETQWQQAEQLTGKGTALLLIDEIPYLPKWSRLLKSEADRIHRQKTSLHVVVTGSAALALGAGTRETMAGRFERLLLTHWPARDLAQAFSLPRQEAIEIVINLGGFPGGMIFRDDPQRWRSYIRDSIIEPAIGRDLLSLETIRKPSLLRQVFAICAGHPAEIVTLQKIAGSLTERGALETISHYLKLLEDAHLVTAIQKFSGKELRRRSSPPKLIPLNNAFVTAHTLHDVAETGSKAESSGRLIENACIAFAINAGQTARYWREEPLEVDAVLDGAWGKWAIEIKTGSYTSGDLAGLLEFVRRFRSYRPLVICHDADLTIAQRAGVSSLPWTEFLWSGIESIT